MDVAGHPPFEACGLVDPLSLAVPGVHMEVHAPEPSHRQVQKSVAVVVTHVHVPGILGGLEPGGCIDPCVRKGAKIGVDLIGAVASHGDIPISVVVQVSEIVAPVAGMSDVRCTLGQ